MIKRRAGLYLLVCGVVAIPIGFLAWLTWVFGGRDAWENRRQQIPFNASKWQRHSLDGNPMWPTRLRMADDLISSHRLIGLSRKEVEQLLGPPDHTSWGDDPGLVYFLGPERGMIRIDSELLFVTLDRVGNVVTVVTVRD